MARCPVVEVTSFQDLLFNVASVRPRSTRVYGFALQNGFGEVRACFGSDFSGCRPQDYVDALRAPPIGGAAGSFRDKWEKVPKRAQHFWRQDFFYVADGFSGVFALKDVPVSFENAASIECMQFLGQDAVCGGIAALRATASVKDACYLLLHHDSGKCVACGGAHLVSDCDLPEEEREAPRMRSLQARCRRAEANVSDLEVALREAQETRPFFADDVQPTALELADRVREEPGAGGETLEEPARASAPAQRRLRVKRPAPEFALAEAVAVQVAPEDRWAGSRGRLQDRCGL